MTRSQPRDAQRPTRRYEYIADGPAIYAESFATIRREADLSRVPPDAEKLAVRMIHGSGQPDLTDDLVIHPELVESILEQATDAPHVVVTPWRGVLVPNTPEVSE